MNRADLQRLADERVRDAEALLDAGRWPAAYYLAGYAVECALKACIAKKTNQYDFPDKTATHDAFTHNVSRLLELAGLKLPLRLATTPAANPALGLNWERVKDWSEASRYELKSEAEARRLHLAVAEPTDGVLKWIQTFW